MIPGARWFRQPSLKDAEKHWLRRVESVQANAAGLDAFVYPCAADSAAS